MNQPDMKKVFQGEIFSIWQWEQEMYDGSKRTFERATRCDVARMIGVLPDKKIMLIMDFQPDRAVGLLGPAGGQVEEGEDPQVAAGREFLEETGYKASTISPLFTLPQKSGRLYYAAYLFIGKNLEKITEPQNVAGERIELRLFTFEEFLALGQNEQLRDMRLRIMLLEAQLDPVKKETLYNLLYA